MAYMIIGEQWYYSAIGVIPSDWLPVYLQLFSDYGIDIQVQPSVKIINGVY